MHNCDRKSSLSQNMCVSCKVGYLKTNYPKTDYLIYGFLNLATFAPLVHVKPLQMISISILSVIILFLCSSAQKLES